MNFEFGTFGHRALEALFNGVYQGLILTGLLWAAYRAISFWNAATRHAVGLLVMLIIAALPLAHLGEAFWLEYRARQAAAAPFVSPGPRVEGLILEPAVFVAPSETPVPQTPRTFAVPLKVSWALVTLWLAIAAFRLGGVGRQCLALRRMKRESLPADPELRSRFDALRAELEVARPVKLGLTEEVRSPIAAGFRHPMVLLPEEAERETTARLDAVLRHELAHVRRRDDWTNLLQQAIQAAFFFHPGVRWLANRLTLEREIACDDHALASLANRRDYALLLTEFASRSARREWVAAPGVWSKQGQLKERIAMIMNSHRNASTRLARTSAGALTLGAALVALLAMQAGPRLALAEEADKAEDRPAFRFEGKAGEVESSSPKGESRAYTVISGPRKKETFVLAGSEKPAADVKPAPEPSALSEHPVPPPTQPPAPPRPSRAARAEAGLEERLERLERMVENMSRDKKDGARHEFHLKHLAPEFDPKFQEKMAKLQTELHEKFNSPEWHKKMEEAHRLGEEAHRRGEEAHFRALEAHGRGELAAKRGEIAARQAEVIVREIEKDGKVERHVEIREPGQPRRKALEEQRRALEQQLRALEKQIREIENDEQRARQEREIDRANRESERSREREERKIERRSEQGDDAPKQRKF